MILTTIQEMDRYVSVNPRFAAAFAAARTLAEKTFAGGRHEVDGEEIFFIPNPALGLWISKERF